MGATPDLEKFEPGDFRVRDRGPRYEDIRVGERFDHHWGRTIRHADNVTFCAATCNWNPLYLNREYARASGHPECPVHPALVVCVVVGLSVEDLSEAAGPFLGMAECTFDRPVYPGDTLTAHSEVLSCRASSSRPGFGILTWRTQGRNQHGERVVSLVRSNLVPSHAGDLDLPQAGSPS